MKKFEDLGLIFKQNTNSYLINSFVKLFVFLVKQKEPKLDVKKE